MKFDLILFLLFTSIILSQTTQEEKEKEIDTTTKNISEELPQNQTAKKPRIKLIDFTYKDTNRKSQTIELTNYNLDSLVKNGEENRWLIIFYAETCSFCKTVKSLIDKIIEEKKYKNVNNIKFGSVDVDYNLYLQMRFNVTGILVFLLAENNKMIELPNMLRRKPDEFHRNRKHRKRQICQGFSQRNKLYRIFIEINIVLPQQNTTNCE